jgi:hypothetical protein
VVRLGSSYRLSPVLRGGLTATAILFPLLWSKRHRSYVEYSFPFGHLPRIPNSGRIDEVLWQALFGKALASFVAWSRHLSPYPLGAELCGKTSRVYPL